jgi:integrase
MASVKRLPNGTYQARWRAYPGGPQTAKNFRRKVDAERHLVKVQHDLMTGAYVDPSKSRTTVEEFYAAWSARQPWRAASRASVASVFETHVLPAFGDRPLGTIRRGDVESWAAGLPLAGSTAALAMTYLSGLFGAAVADGLVVANPLRGAKRPRVDVAPVVPPALDELDRIRDALAAWLQVAVTLGAAVGLRQAEITGLTVDRVNFLARTLVVDRQLLTPPKGETTFGPPKTPRSYRTIPLADVALEDISRHVAEHGTGTDGLIVHEAGRPIRRQRFDRLWSAARTRAGVPDARFHDTRHTYASTLLSGGVSVAAAAEYLGHSPGVLLRTYAHLIPADHDRARAVVQTAFARAAEDSVRTQTATGDG